MVLFRHVSLVGCGQVITWSLSSNGAEQAGHSCGKFSSFLCAIWPVGLIAWRCLTIVVLVSEYFLMICSYVVQSMYWNVVSSQSNLCRRYDWSLGSVMAWRTLPLKCCVTDWCWRMNCVGVVDGYLLRIKVPSKKDVKNVRSFFVSTYRQQQITNLASLTLP